MGLFFSGANIARQCGTGLLFMMRNLSISPGMHNTSPVHLKRRDMARLLKGQA